MNKACRDDEQLSSSHVPPSRRAERSAARDGPRHTVYWVAKSKRSSSSPTKSKVSRVRLATFSKLKPKSCAYSVSGKYTGNWKDGQRDGYGVFVYENGSKYEGEWNNGKREGKGTLWIESKPSRKLRKQYAGEWHNGKRHGMGTFYYEDGSKYEGMWHANHREGQGIMHFANDRSIYDGQWLEDQRSGTGTLWLSNGDRYDGHWLGDKKEGPGRFIYKSTNKVYEGEWLDGVPRCGTYREYAGSPGGHSHAPRFDSFQLPELELANSQQIVSQSAAMMRQERVMKESVRNHHKKQKAPSSESNRKDPQRVEVQAVREQEQETEEEDDQVHENVVVFDEETLRLIQHEFNAFAGTNGMVRCNCLTQILSKSIDLDFEEAQISQFLQEIGANDESWINFEECVDILSLLVENEMDQQQELGRETGEEMEGEQVPSQQAKGLPSVAEG